MISLVSASLFIFGQDNTNWFQSFFFIAFVFVVTFDVLADFFMILVCDILIPNMIHSVVMYAKSICSGQAQTISTKSYSLDRYDSFSASRYLHASHFYSDCVEFSIEKVFVVSYINPFPSRIGLSTQASFSSPVGMIFMSIVSYIPISLQKLLVNAGSSVGLLYLFLIISTSSGSSGCYGTACGLLLVISMVYFFGVSSVKNTGARHRVHPEEMMQDSVLNRNVQAKVSDLTSVFSRHQLRVQQTPEVSVIKAV